MNTSLLQVAQMDTATGRGINFRKYGLAIFLLAVLATGALISPKFIAQQNLTNMALQWSPLAIVTIGQAFVILVRGLDLSVASIMATTAVVAASFDGKDSDLPMIAGISLAIALAAGLLNGILVTKRKVSPFLATLATMILLQGFRFAYTQGVPAGQVPPSLRSLGTANVAGIPYNFIVLVAIALVFWVILARSVLGRQVYLVGGNPTMARLVGINADRVTIFSYVISAVLAAIGGLVLSGYVGIVDNWVGRGFELDTIVAAVVGGVALSGGRGTLFGALLGAALITVVGNAVLMLGLSVDFQNIVKGVVIILAAAVYSGKFSRTK